MGNLYCLDIVFFFFCCDDINWDSFCCCFLSAKKFEMVLVGDFLFAVLVEGNVVVVLFVPVDFVEVVVMLLLADFVVLLLFCCLLNNEVNHEFFFVITASDFEVGDIVLQGFCCLSN